MMEVIQPPVGGAGAAVAMASKQRAQRQRRPQAPLLISSASSPSSVSSSPSPSSFRYSCASSLSCSSSSVCSASSPFFLHDQVEVLSRSNTSSPGEGQGQLPSSAASYRRAHYRSASSRPLSSCNSPSRCAGSSSSSSSSSSSAVPGDTAGLPGAKLQPRSCATRPSRSATLPTYNSNLPASISGSSTANCSLPRADADGRLSWYNPLLSERFQLDYVDESAEDLEDYSGSCDSSDTEGPSDGKPLFQAIQESILYFNTAAGIPIPEFVDKHIHNRGPLPNPNSHETPISLSITLQNRLPDSGASSHVKKPSLVLLGSASEDFAPILETEAYSPNDSSSLYNWPYPGNPASSSLISPSFSSKEAAEAHARERIDLELEAAIKESTRVEEVRRAGEAEEDAAYLRALHESILAEKEAQVRREDLEFLDRLFSKRRRPSSSLSTCSSVSSTSIYSLGNSTTLTALSPPPPRTPNKQPPSVNTPSEMPSTQEDVAAPLSHNSKERPISAIREKKSRSKASTAKPDEVPEDGPLRPTLHRAHTSSSGGFKRLLGLSGRSSRAESGDDDRHHAKTPPSKKASEKPPMDRRASEPNAAHNLRRHRHHRHSDESEKEAGHRHHHHHHHHHKRSEGSSPTKESKEKRRSKEKVTISDETSSRGRSRSQEDVVGPTPVAPPAEPATTEAVPADKPEAPAPSKESSSKEKKKRWKKHASIGDILRVSRKLKTGAPVEPAAPVEPPKMVECVTCMSDDIPETEAAQLECGHAFCNDCLVRLFDLSLTDPAHMPPRCCQPAQHIPLQHVDKLLSTKTKILWNKKYQEFTTTNRRYCPATDCGEWIRPKDFTTVNGAEVGTCPRCKLNICGLCGLKEHGTEECPKDEFLNQVRELGKELGWQRCYSCRAMVELERGCNHMTCRCTAEFCMICGAKWKTCECPWFNFPPEEDDAPLPQRDGNGVLVDDLAWGWDRRNEDDERAARQLAADFAEIDTGRHSPNTLSAWAPLFTGAIGEGVLRLLSRTRHLEGAAMDRLRHAYASAVDDDFIFGGSDDESEKDEVPELPSQGVRSHARPTPTLRGSQSDMHEQRRRQRDSTYNLDWSPQGSTEDLHQGVNFSFLPQLTRAFLPSMFGGHHHHHHHGDGEFGTPPRSYSEDIGRYGDLLEGDLNRARRDFDNVRWGGIGAA